MKLDWQAGPPLAAGRHGAMFDAWVAAPGGAAAADTRRALGEPRGAEAAPLFAGAEGASWRAARGADDGEGWEPGLLGRLAAGACDVVVTGQQPGFLGGPLLVLHKVATALALAEARTAAGLPTVAVFWCGDDDDDLVEALAPAGWDPAADALVRAEGRIAARAGTLGRPLVGGTLAARWCAPGAGLLRRLAQAPAPTKAAVDLAELWQEALAGGWTWSRLNVAALRRVFAGRPLAIVRGGDADLHRAAAPFYGHVALRRDRCRELAEREGLRLAAITGRAPVTERSLEHHLFEVSGDGRKPVAAGTVLPPAERLRPGVMLRSLVQDWLLRPVAVVVGPGERAYLAQLEPLYADLGVPRCALVPRLFAWSMPAGVEAGRVLDLAARAVAGAGTTERLATELAAGVEAAVGASLAQELGVAAPRAAALAAGRARRWRRGVAAMLRDEVRRQWRAQAGALPACLFPDGQRQERALAWAGAVATWGDALPAALVAAAHDHLARGAGGDWRDYVVAATDDGPSTTTGRA